MELIDFHKFSANVFIFICLNRNFITPAVVSQSLSRGRKATIFEIVDEGILNVIFKLNLSG